MSFRLARRPRDRRRLVAIGVATVALALAIGVRWSANVWLTTGLAGAVAIVAAVVADRRALRDRLADPRSGILVGLACGVAMVLLTRLLFALGSELVPELVSRTADLYGDLEDAPGPRAAAPILALVVVGEELVWRGIVPALLAGRLGGARAVAAATLLYALPQAASGSLLLFAVALAAGAVWSGLGLHRDDLWAPLACHMVWSLSLFSLWPLF